jgi:hypothetical protein
MRELLAILFIFLLWIGTYKQFGLLRNPTPIALAQETTTSKKDPNLSDATSWCPDYRRFNKDWVSQRCLTLSSVWVSLRTEELLKDYWLNNYNEREVMWRLHNIKTEVLVCITYADTSIGKYMKSNNNIGNVGNNDRWQTVDYASLLKGIDAIGRVLNNKYLWQREELRQLAGSTNPSWPNYATELTNWVRQQNWIINVQNCLSLIHDTKQDGWYKIRR